MHKIEPVAYIHTEFQEKFGIPRQSGLVPSLRATIVFEEKYDHEDWIRGLEEYDYLWIIFDFSMAHRSEYSPLVSPPRLGGKEKKGVFATRSPFRPNSLGLSSVQLLEIQRNEKGILSLLVAGADLLDGTPIYDIKPYLPYADSHPQAKGGFGQEHARDRLEVVFPEDIKKEIGEDIAQRMIDVLAQDPRAAFQKKEDYIYGMSFLDYDVRFGIKGETISVVEVVARKNQGYSKVK